jgi:hypothetical protein
MGRGHVGRLAAAALAALFLACAASAAAGLRFGAVAAGKTAPVGRQQPVGYVARSLAAARAWLPRLAPADRRLVARLDFRTRAAVAVFLDGFPCASELRVTGFSTDRRRVVVSFKKAPIGVATCIRDSISYAVVQVAKADLPKGSGGRISVVTHARA